MGEQKETLTRICHELPGYNWLEEKIRKSATNDQPTAQVQSSSSSSAVTNEEDGPGGGNNSQPKTSPKATEQNSSQE